MRPFLPSLQGEIQSRGLLARGQKILFAVSGGADSMVLLHALNCLRAENNWKIFVAHFNHQLRGRASDADEKLVRQTAADLHLPFFAERADVKAFAKKSSFSIEMAARKLRHEFFARVARSQKISTVALAHHADDQVELFFLRVLRGAGGEGLAGMKWSSPSPADKNITLIRPLLALTKSELLAFARENKIRFREDATNASADFLRNRIRHELLPLLKKKYQPGLAKTVLRLMEIIGAEAEFAGEVARACQTKSGKRKPESGNKFRTPHVVAYNFDFEKLPVAVQRKFLQQQLFASGLAADFELIEQLRKTIDEKVSLSSELAVARDAFGKIKLFDLKQTQPFDADELRLKFKGRAGHATFGSLNFQWSIQNKIGARRRGDQAGAEFFDADKIGGEIILRHWRAGDRFQPIGMASPVKLQDLFVNAKIPRDRRRELVVATTAAGEIFWVQPLRIGEKFKLTAQTARRLICRWNKSE